MCGVIGVSRVPDAARLAYLGLYALQHRGQESAGIVAVDATAGAGAPRHGARLGDLRRREPSRSLPGDVAVGHTRYSTAGSTVLANAQPCLVNYRAAVRSAVAHNGNLTNAARAQRELVEQGAIFTSSHDTEVLVHLIARSERADDGRPDPRGAGAGRGRLLPRHQLSAGTLYAVVDPRGFRPLLLGRLGEGIDRRLRDLRPRPGGRHRHPRAAARRVRPHRRGRRREPRAAAGRARSRRCVFELVYFARPDSTIFGESVDAVRREIGRQLAREHPAPGRRGRLLGARQLQRDGARLQRGVGHQARVRPDPQPLRRPHLHQPDAGASASPR